MTLAELMQKRAKVAADMRALHAECGDNEMTSEHRTRWEGFKTELKQLEDQIQREEEVRELERYEIEQRAADSKSRRPAGSVDERRAQAFNAWLRRGMSDLDDEHREVMREMRAQATDPGSAGGFTVPTDFIARVFESLSDYGGIASVAQIMVTDNGRSIEWPTSDGSSEMGDLIGENQQADEGDVTFGMGSLGAHKLSSKIIRVSNELLIDAGLDMEGFLSGRLASRLGRAEAHYVVKGTGQAAAGGAPAQPKGLEASAVVGKITASAAAFTWQEINGLIHSVDPAYRRSPKFRLGMNDTTLMHVENMEDDKKRPIWLPGIDAKAPAVILGHPYVIDTGIADLAAGAKFMYAGDFSQFIIRRVRSMILKRLTERYADFDQTGFLGFMRFGCVLQDLAAVKSMQAPGEPDEG